MTLFNDAEIRLAGMGLDLTECPAPFADLWPADIDSCLVLDLPVQAVYALIRPGSPPEVRALTAEWAERVLSRFADHGPEPDGWQPRPDGGYQLSTRVVSFPQEVVDL